MDTQVFEIGQTDIFKTEAITPEVIQNTVDRIVRYLNPEKIILFGSRARKDHHSESDLDLLVVMETSVPKLERRKFVSRLIRPRFFSADFKVYTPQEFNEAANHPDYFFNPFIKEALQDGKILYERKATCGNQSSPERKGLKLFS